LVFLFLCAQAAGQMSLPVRRVVLYKNGLGYFEHAGQVRGSERVDIVLPSRQLDDVLKSLTVIDRSQGRVAGVTYESSEPIARRLAELPLRPDPQAGLMEFLNKAPGVEVEVRTPLGPVTGRLMGAEIRQKKSGEYIIGQTLLVNVFTARGEVRALELPSPAVLRLLRPDLAGELQRYLELLDSAHRRDTRRLAIQTSADTAAARPLHVSYTSEAPIWKTTYRLVLDEGQPPLLQGWAIVDNTTPNEWNNVELSLVAGAPVSFIQQLSLPRYARRPVIPLPGGVEAAPQVHQATLQVTVGESGISGTVFDPAGALVPNATVSVRDPQQRLVLQAYTNDQGQYAASLPPGNYSVDFHSPGFKTNRLRVTVHRDRRSLIDTKLELGNVTETIAVQAEPLHVETSTSSMVAVRSGAPRLELEPSSGELLRQFSPETAEAASLGIQFQYKLRQPVTIRRNESALLPILHAEVQGERVALYCESCGSRPLAAVWLNNSSGLTLDSGSFSVIDSGAFAGEGLTTLIHPGERRLLSYAIDTAVEVKWQQEPAPQTLERVELAGGYAKFTHQSRMTRTYTIRNNDDRARIVVIEHPVNEGWRLLDTSSPEESSSGYHRFRVPAPAKTTIELAVHEAKPEATNYDLSDLDREELAEWVKQGHIDSALEPVLRELVERQETIDGMLESVLNLDKERSEIIEDQKRLRENLAKLAAGAKDETTLRQRYVSKLQEQEDRLAAIRDERARLTKEKTTAEESLKAWRVGLKLERKVSPGY
jgi:hypothetical protein